MTLQEAIDLYVLRKQAAGLSYSKGDTSYRAFLSTTGNLPLNRINIDHVLQFLNRPQASVKAFRRKHSLLRRFFDYWTDQGAISELQMPPNLPAQHSNFLPYIFSRDEVRRLLRIAVVAKTPNDKIHDRTLRAAFLMLYATGATVGEVAKLCNEDVDLESGFIKFSGSRLKVGRSVPMGHDLLRAMRQYSGWRRRTETKSYSFFSRMDGSRTSSATLRAYFDRYREKVGILGHRDSGQKPCLRDLRATFAVHQITSWIKTKKDLRVMLPALAAYMGNVSLESTERYLQLAPQRFQNALDKLSPSSEDARWRTDSALLEFLTQL